MQTVLKFNFPVNSQTQFIEQPSARPTTSYSLTTIGVPGYRLRKSLTVETAADGRDVLVSDPVLNVYGSGGDLQAALDDYASMLVDLYEELLASEAILSNSLRLQLEYLREVLARA